MLEIPPMTRRIVHHLAAISRKDRSEMNRELSRAIAFENAHKPAQAQVHGSKLVRLLLALRLLKAE
jgi:hypothetical protein